MLNTNFLIATSASNISLLQRILLLCPLHTSLPIHQRPTYVLCNPGLEDDVHRVRDRIRVEPEWGDRDRHWPARLEPGRQHEGGGGGGPWPKRYGFQGYPFLPGPLTPPILELIALQWSEWARKGFNTTRQKNKTEVFEMMSAFICFMNRWRKTSKVTFRQIQELKYYNMNGQSVKR